MGRNFQREHHSGWVMLRALDGNIAEGLFGVVGWGGEPGNESLAWETLCLPLKSHALSWHIREWRRGQDFLKGEPNMLIFNLFTFVYTVQTEWKSLQLPLDIRSFICVLEISVIYQYTVQYTLHQCTPKWDRNDPEEAYSVLKTKQNQKTKIKQTNKQTKTPHKNSAVFDELHVSKTILCVLCLMIDV